VNSWTGSAPQPLVF